MDLNNTIDQRELTHVYRTFHLTAAEYIFYSNVQGKVSGIDHMVGYKTSLNKLKKTEIIKYLS